MTTGLGWGRCHWCGYVGRVKKLPGRKDVWVERGIPHFNTNQICAGCYQEKAPLVHRKGVG